MTGQVTSPQSAGAWRRFAAFLRRPVLPTEPAGLQPAALPELGKLFALDLLLMIGLMALAGIVLALGFEMPAHMLDGLELDAWLVAFMLIGAPLGEEIVFRGWLSGRPGHVWASLIALAAALLVFLSATLAPGLIDPLVALVALASAAVLAPTLLWLKRGRQPSAWYHRHFRWFYFASTLAFATVHLTNFGADAALILLPLTLPQLLLGLILGYARVQFGLWACVLLHAGHNSIFVGLLVAGSG